MSIVSDAWKEYEGIGYGETRSKRKSPWEERRKKFADYLDEQLMDKKFENKREARRYLVQKKREYHKAYGIGFIEGFILSIFLKWLFGKIVDFLIEKYTGNTY